MAYKCENPVELSERETNCNALSDWWTVERSRDEHPATRSCLNLSEGLLLEYFMKDDSPNMGLLHKLKCAIESQVTRFFSVVENIVTYEDVSQPKHLVALVVFLTKMHCYPFSQGIPKDPMELPKSLVLIKVWLYKLILKTLLRLNDQKCPFKIMEELLMTSAHLLDLMLSYDVSKGLICLALSEADPDTVSTSGPFSLPFPSCQLTYFHKLRHLSKEINRLLCQPFCQQVDNELRQSLIRSTNIDSYNMANLEVPPVQPLEGSDLLNNLITNILVIMNAYLFPDDDLQVLVEKLVVLEQVQNIKRPQLYSEILRSCYLGLLDDDIKPEDIKWNVFIYIKVPILFSKLLQMSKAKDTNMELCLGVEHLLDTPFLLDSIDSKYNFDCLQLLIDQFVKQKLLTENHIKRIFTKRRYTTIKMLNQMDVSLVPNKSVSLILKTFEAFDTMLEKLDVQNKWNTMLPIMNLILRQKSLGLISLVAAAAGKLQTFVSKLIWINEESKEPPEENETWKDSLTRATMFDISFLMLCHIVQIHDLKGRFPLEPYIHVDNIKCNSLLEHLESGTEFESSMTRWDETCFLVMQAVDMLSFQVMDYDLDLNLVKESLETIRYSRWCFPAVMAATYLCERRKQWSISYMLEQVHSWVATELEINSEGNQERSFQMRQFMNYLGSDIKEEEDSINLMPKSKSVGDSKDGQLIYIFRNNYQERHHLGMQFVNYLSFVREGDLYYSSKESKRRLLEIFQEIHSGFFKVGSMVTLKNLKHMNSRFWYAKTVVKAMLSYELCWHMAPEDLTKGVYVAHALFNLDLEELTWCLLTFIVPEVLMKLSKKFKNENKITEPGWSAIIKLTITNLHVLARMSRTSLKDLKNELVESREKFIGHFLEVEKSKYEMIQLGFPSVSSDKFIREVLPLKTNPLESRKEAFDCFLEDEEDQDEMGEDEIEDMSEFGSRPLYTHDNWEETMPLESNVFDCFLEDADDQDEMGEDEREYKSELDSLSKSTHEICEAPETQPLESREEAFDCFIEDEEDQDEMGEDEREDMSELGSLSTSTHDIWEENHSNNSSTQDSKDLLTEPITDLLHRFLIVLTNEDNEEQKNFVLKFIGELLKSGTTTSCYVLQYSPSDLAQLVAKFMHKELTVEQIFRFADISDAAKSDAVGKRSIAMAIFRIIGLEKDV